MTDQLPPLNGIARKKRSDAGTPRKSTMSPLLTFSAACRRTSNKPR